MQISTVHVEREEIGPKRVRDDLHRDVASRSESLSTTEIELLDPRQCARAPVKEILSYQEHPRPEGNVFWNEFYSGLWPSSHESSGKCFKSGR